MLTRNHLAAVVVAVGIIVNVGDTVRGDEKASKTADDLASQIAVLEQFGRVFESISDQIGPAVVHIRSRRPTSILKRNFTLQETGSGVITKLEGISDPFILTNSHVVDNVEIRNLTITTPDGRVLTPTNVAADARSDIAVVRIEQSDVATAPIGNSDKIGIGHWVLAIGSPFDLAGSLTLGIVSGKGRRALGRGSNGVLNQDFIQTDAAINPGNSGGPLVNLRGQIVGINTAIASQSGGSEGVGFAVPVNLASHIARELLTKGKVQRAFLGIQFNGPLSPSDAGKLGLARVRGAWVRNVLPETPAEKAAIKSMDVITLFNDRPIENQEHLTNLISMTPVGREVELSLWRDRKPMKVKVKLEDRADLEGLIERLPSAPDADVARMVLSDLGMEVRGLTATQKSRFGYPSDQSGVLIHELVPFSQASQVVERFDVIDQVERTPVRSLDEFRDAISRADSGEGILVRVVRPTEKGIVRQQVVIRR